MERKVKFIEGEYYHIYTRGVEKRNIFLDSADYERFMALLYILNQRDTFRMSNYLANGKKNPRNLYQNKRSDQLVDILAFSIMPNHFHLVIRETGESNISKFMMKLLTAYSMYFNKKYERSGPLFVRPFRSSHLGEDAYFRHIFSYVHLNCLDLYQNNWKQDGVSNILDANTFLEKYRYSSYPDFVQSLERPEAKIINFNALPDFIARAPLAISEYEGWKNDVE